MRVSLRIGVLIILPRRALQGLKRRGSDVSILFSATLFNHMKAQSKLLSVQGILFRSFLFEKFCNKHRKRELLGRTLCLSVAEGTLSDRWEDPKRFYTNWNCSFTISIYTTDKFSEYKAIDVQDIFQYHLDAALLLLTLFFRIPQQRQGLISNNP